MRAVAQHNLQKVARLQRRVDRPAEAPLVQKRQVAGVVDVRVRHQRAQDVRRRYGKLAVDEAVHALLHAAIDDKCAAIDG